MQDGSLVHLPDGSTWRAPSLASADRETVRWHGFEAFTRMALPHLPGVPARPLWNWHFAELCRHAQALYEGKCSVLNETLPPGVGKSRINAILFPVFLWTQDPSLHIMTATYHRSLVREFAEDTMDLLKTRWFKERWGNMLKEQKAAPNIEQIRSRKGGVRYSLTAPKGKGTGIHGDYYILDDLIRAQEAELPGALRKVTDWIGTSVFSRGRMTGPLKVMSGMQRLALRDPAAVLRESFEGLSTYVELMLPYRFEPERRCVTPFGGDRRTHEGELLWDVPFLRTTALTVERMTGGPNSQQARAQLQQDPTSGDDAIFDEKYFGDFTLDAVPFGSTIAIISVDPTFTNGKKKKKGKADYVALEVWGVRIGADGELDYYCFYSEEKRRSFTETVAAIKALRLGWPGIILNVIEEAAAGTAIIDTLEQAGIPVEGVSAPGGTSGDMPIGKIMRAKAVSYMFKAGRVHFLKDAPWYKQKARNLVQFPFGPNDDDVDTTSQALLFLSHRFGMSGTWASAVGGWEEELKHLTTHQDIRGLIDVDGVSVPLLVG